MQLKPPIAQMHSAKQIFLTLGEMRLTYTVQQLKEDQLIDLTVREINSQQNNFSFIKMFIKQNSRNLNLNLKGRQKIQTHIHIY